MQTKIKKVELRNLAFEDYKQLKNSMVESYPEMADSYWRSEDIERLLAIFPEGQLVILADGKVKFSIYAPKAAEVTVSGDYSPKFGADKLTKDGVGVWSFTTDYVVNPNLYTYDFNVDGLKIFDPKNAQYKESNSGFSNLFEVKGGGTIFKACKMCRTVNWKRYCTLRRP